MNQQDIYNIFRNVNALLEGHFILTSGMHSAQYLQCARVLEQPEIAMKLCGLLASRFRKSKPTVVIGPAIGGIVVSYELARALGAKSYYTERIDNKMCLRRGFKLTHEDKVVVVEDVITTGGSIQEVIDIVKMAKAEVVGVGCLADRTDESINLNFKWEYLLKVNIPLFKPDECPLCRNEIPLEKPGSRGLK